MLRVPVFFIQCSLYRNFADKGLYTRRVFNPSFIYSRCSYMPSPLEGRRGNGQSGIFVNYSSYFLLYDTSDVEVTVTMRSLSLYISSLSAQ